MEIVDEPFIIKGQSDGQGTVERDEQWSSPYQFRLQRHNNSHDCGDGAFYFRLRRRRHYRRVSSHNQVHSSQMRSS